MPVIKLQFNATVADKIKEISNHLPDKPDTIEVIRRALAVYEFFILQEAMGSKVCMKHSDDSLQEVVLSPFTT